MRKTIFLFLLYAFSVGGADFPIFLRLGTNTLSLPKGSEALWITTPNSGKGWQIIPLAPSSNDLFQAVTVQAIPDGAGISYSSLVHSGLPTNAAARLKLNRNWSSIRPLLLDPEFGFIEVEGPQTIAGTVQAATPYSYTFSAKRGKPIKFEVVANRIGSSLDPVVSIMDETGKNVSFQDDGEFSGRDSAFVFIAPRKGKYTLQIRDIANAGGPEFFFALRSNMAELSYIPKEGCPRSMPWHFLNEPRITERDTTPTPNEITTPFVGRAAFQEKDERLVYVLKPSSSATTVFSIETRKLGSPCDAEIRLLNENGTLVAESAGVGAEGAALTNRVEAGKAYKIEVREISRRFGPGLKFELTVAEKRPGVVLASEIERLSFSKEGEAKIKIASKRYDYDGPVRLRVEGLPEGVEVVDGVIPEKKNEAELRLKRTKEVEAFQVRIFGAMGKEEAGGKKEEEFRVSTMPALRKLYPLMMFPTAAMDGWIAVNPAE